MFFLLVRADASGKAEIDERDGGQLFGGAVIGYEDDVEVCCSRHA